MLGLELLDGCALALCPCEAVNAALESAVFCCCTAFSLALVLSMMLGFCAPAVPSPIPRIRIPVASFIGLP